MNLIWHECKTEAVRWRWLILLWWLIMLLDLGYQVDWWRSFQAQGTGDTTLVRAQDSISDFVKQLVRLTIWIGLGTIPVVLFSPLSPNRVTSALRIRPLSRASLIATRALLLTVCIGLPWWLHEFLYLQFTVAPGITITARAVIERILWTAMLWLPGAALGWVSGSLWRALFTAAVGFALACAGLYVAESLDPFAPDLWHRHPTMTSHSVLVWCSIGAVATAGLFLGQLWRSRSRLPSRWKYWAPFLLSCFSLVAVYAMANRVALAWLIGCASHPDLLPKVWTPQVDPHASFASLPEGASVPTWTMVGDYSGLPENLNAYLYADTAEWHVGNPTRVEILENIQHDGFGIGTPPSMRELHHAMRKFSEALVLANGYGEPRLAAPSANFTPSSETADLGEPLLDDLTAVAEADIDFWQMGAWYSLPLDFSAADMGSLRQVQLYQTYPGRFGPLPTAQEASHLDHSILSLSIRFYPHHSFTDAEVAVPPRRIFGLWSEQHQQLALIPNSQITRTIGGSASAFPLKEITLTTKVPPWLTSGVYGVVGRQPWPDGTHLVMFESRYIGSSHATLSQSDLDAEPTSSIGHGNGPIRAAIDPPSLESVWRSSQASEAEFRFALYQHLAPFGDKPKPALAELAENHRPTLRRMATQAPLIFNYFRSDWPEPDREWILDQILDRQPIPHDMLEYVSISGWLASRPEWVKMQFEQRPNSLSLQALEIAVEQNLPGAREAFYRHYLDHLDRTHATIDPADHTTFSDLREATETRLLSDWNENRWQLNLAGGFVPAGPQLARLGDPQPLRETLTAFVRQSENLPSDFTDPNTDLRWMQLWYCFAPAKNLTPNNMTERLGIAKRWLAAEWIYDPATLNYKVIETKTPPQ